MLNGIFPRRFVEKSKKPQKIIVQMNYRMLTKCKINGINIIYKSQQKILQMHKFSVRKGDSDQ